MKSLSSVGLGLSVVFGCLFLALIAELYYLLWWKKRLTTRDIEDDYIFCWKKPSSLSSTALNPQALCSSTDTQVHEPQAQVQSNKDMWLRPFGEDSVETELLRMQNLSGPPRFLFTIKEETKEDLESEDAKSRGDKSRKGSRTRSLSDLLLIVETPFLTPLASPSCFTPPLTPKDTSYGHSGFNPLFESSSDAEFNRIRSSPPPKFKFLRDAEDKLHKTKLMEEHRIVVGHRRDGSVEEDGVKVPSNSMFLKDEENGSFITLIVAKNTEKEVDHNHNHNHPQYPSSSSQILPLTASPPTIRPSSKKHPGLH